MPFKKLEGNQESLSPGPRHYDGHVLGIPDQLTEVYHTNFAYTYFVENQAEIEQINLTLKQFWEIENVQSPHDAPIVRIEEQVSMKKVESTLSFENQTMKKVESTVSFENQMYRVGIPWKSDTRALPDNYEVALRRLENTEKWLVPRHCTGIQQMH